MCGRYQLGIKGKDENFGYHFGVDKGQIAIFKDNYNVAPSQTMPIVVKHSPNSIQMMKWGLIPSWSKDGKSLVINSRAETIAEKPMFKKLLETQRCIVPSTGFYEWRRVGKEKTPFYIGIKNHEFFGFAGLYDVWKNPKGEDIYSYTIITCEPNKLMSEIHNRMPVILEKDDEEKWLNPDTVEPERLVPLLNPLRDEFMTAYPISTRVNSPTNNDETIDERVQIG